MKIFLKILFWVVGVAILTFIFLITYVHTKNLPKEDAANGGANTINTLPKQDTSKVDTLWNKALTYGKGEMNVQQLEAIYNQIINDYPNDSRLAEAYAERGFFVYGNLNKYTEAISDYRKSIELNPSDDFSKFMIADSYYRLGKTKEMCKSLTVVNTVHLFSLGNYKESYDEFMKNCK